MLRKRVKLRKREIDTRITKQSFFLYTYVHSNGIGGEVSIEVEKREVKNRFAYFSITTPQSDDDDREIVSEGPLGNWVECIEKLETSLRVLYE